MEKQYFILIALFLTFSLVLAGCPGKGVETEEDEEGAAATETGDDGTGDGDDTGDGDGDGGETIDPAITILVPDPEVETATQADITISGECPDLEGEEITVLGNIVGDPPEAPPLIKAQSALSASQSLEVAQTSVTCSELATFSIDLTLTGADGEKVIIFIHPLTGFTAISIIKRLCSGVGLDPSGLAAGTGTAEDPYIICTVYQMQNMEDDLTAFYELSGDIDASATATDTAEWPSGFRPVGNSGGAFTGSFNGLGLVISNLFMAASASGVGLFGWVGSGAVITNFTMENPDVSASSSTSVGAAVGYMYGTDTEVSDIKVSGGSVSGGGSTTIIGGVVGKAHTRDPYSLNILQDLTSSADVSDGSRDGGGILGAGYNFNLKNLFSTGSLSYAGGTVGGIAGYLRAYAHSSYGGGPLKVDNLASDMTITTSGYNVGGLIGYHSDFTLYNGYPYTPFHTLKMNKSFSDVTISHPSFAWTGGLVGNISYNAYLDISKSASKAIITADSGFIGGLASGGWGSYQNFEDVYFDGLIEITSTSYNPTSVGGITAGRYGYGWGAARSSQVNKAFLGENAALIHPTAGRLYGGPYYNHVGGLVGHTNLQYGFGSYPTGRLQNSFSAGVVYAPSYTYYGFGSPPFPTYPGYSSWLIAQLGTDSRYSTPYYYSFYFYNNFYYKNPGNLNSGGKASKAPGCLMASRSSSEGGDISGCDREFSLSGFYSSSHPVYTSGPGWSTTTWTWSGSGMPTLNDLPSPPAAP